MIAGAVGSPKGPDSQATLGGLLAKARRRAFVGRRGELDLFAQALDPASGIAALFVHGPGGIGKTTLLHRYEDMAGAAGRTALLVDGRGIGADRDAFMASVASRLGLAGNLDPVPVLHERPAPVLLLDTYEALQMDRWLRDEFLPSLPAQALVVIAGRAPPGAGWREDSGWHAMLRVVPLGDLQEEDARAFLDARAVPASRHDDVLAIAGGHPLALALLADLHAQSGVLPSAVTDVPDVVEVLLARFVDEVPSEAHRDVLSLAAIAATVTESLLQAVLEPSDPGELFAWLRGLSFVEARQTGLMVHDVARDVLVADLRWRDEERFRRLRRRAGAHHARTILTTDGVRQERALREALFLDRMHPLCGPYWAWQDLDAVGTRPLQPADLDVLVALAEELEGPAAARVTRHWAARAPGNFLVFRRGTNPEPSGFAVFLELEQPDEDDLEVDPVVASGWRWVLDHGPPRPGEHVFFGRLLVSRDNHGRPGPEIDKVLTRSTLRWLRDPRLSWSLVTAPGADHDYWEPLYHYADSIRIDDTAVEVDGKTWILFGHDWRAVPPRDYLRVIGDRAIRDDLDPREIARGRPIVYRALSPEDFAEAVRAALRAVRTPALLADSPLVGSRAIRTANGPGNVGDGGAAGGEAVLRALESAVDALRGAEHGERLHRAVATTYFKGVPTQEAAAERMGLPFSTYRRHLAAGVDQVVDWLWKRELGDG
jgi:hypothetical protein